MARCAVSGAAFAVAAARRPVAASRAKLMQSTAPTKQHDTLPHDARPASQLDGCGARVLQQGESGMKFCAFCGNMKPPTAFRRASGWQCKSCRNLIDAMRRGPRIKGPDAPPSPHTRARNPGKAIASRKLRNARYRDDPSQQIKHRARNQATRALRRGIIAASPCRNCGAEKAQAHHPDYSKPLDVIWLCEPCHKHEHRRIKANQALTPFVGG